MRKGRRAAERNILPGYSTLFSDPFQNRYSWDCTRWGREEEGQSNFFGGYRSTGHGPGLPRPRGSRGFMDQVWKENGAGVASVHRRSPPPPTVGSSGLSGQTAWQAQPRDNSLTHFLVPQQLGWSAQLVRPRVPNLTAARFSSTGCQRSARQLPPLLAEHTLKRQRQIRGRLLSKVITSWFVASITSFTTPLSPGRPSNWGGHWTPCTDRHRGVTPPSVHPLFCCTDAQEKSSPVLTSPDEQIQLVRGSLMQRRRHVYPGAGAAASHWLTPWAAAAGKEAEPAAGDTRRATDTHSRTRTHSDARILARPPTGSRGRPASRRGAEKPHHLTAGAAAAAASAGNAILPPRAQTGSPGRPPRRAAAAQGERDTWGWKPPREPRLGPGPSAGRGTFHALRKKSLQLSPLWKRAINQIFFLEEI